MSTNYKLKGVREEDELALQGTSGNRGWGNNVNVGSNEKGVIRSAFKKMLPLLAEEKNGVILAIVSIFINSSMLLIGPLIVGYTVDRYITTGNFHGLLLFSILLAAVYIIAFVANLIQMRTMGNIGQRTLFRLRNLVFNKLQELPIAFFNQNRAGDLISRLNNDTDKLNQFFSQTLMQFASNAFVIIGAGVFVVVINWRLGLAALAPALFLFVFSQAISSWVKKVNLESLRAEGAMSGEIQESLENFRVILVFNRRDYFRERFHSTNLLNFKRSFVAGLANNIFGPIYDFAGNSAQLIVLTYGIFMIIHGQLAVGILISYLLYVSRFYDPLRQLAQLWSSLQVSLAAWDRLSEVLVLENNLLVLPARETHDDKSEPSRSVMEFRDVSFSYPDGKEVLHHINFKLERGKTYALVGPTGGGKTTTASIIARLYDPTDGEVLFDGRDIRTYDAALRTSKISFILQEPFLFSGTVRENILYGNDALVSRINASKDGPKENDPLVEMIRSTGLSELMERFEDGLDTKISGGSETISLGQRQLIAFIRAVLRQPDLLILDEATANIDTVTEQLLEQILKKLPSSTTKVIIAHRLNTIENADDIFFVNAGEIVHAGSFEHAVNMLLHGKRKS